MNLKKALSTESICLALKSTTKQAIIEEMIDLLLRSGKFVTVRQLCAPFRSAKKRCQQVCKTGSPYLTGRRTAWTDWLQLLASRRKGLRLSRSDGQPSTIFIMTLSPANRTGPHIQFLAEISRLLNSPEAREQILEAETESDLLAMIIET